jgi:E3 ubiquitin-protein ligase TRIP12
LMFNYPGLV